MARWIRPEARERIYKADNYVCQFALVGRCVLANKEYTSSQLTKENANDRFSLDHILPRCQGGMNQPSNLITVHRLCNSTRQDKSIVEWIGAQGVEKLANINKRVAPTLLSVLGG